MTKNVLVIHSKPGLGKSTLAQSVTEALNRQGITAARFSIGDRLRDVCAGTVPSAYHNKVKECRDILARNGVIDEPALIHGIVKEALDEMDVKVIVMDGHPRFQRLVPGFVDMVQNGTLNLIKVIIIDGSDSFARERMTTRNRWLFGVSENAEERLQTHKREVEPGVIALEEQFGALHIDATKHLSDKTAEVVACVREASLV